MALRVSKGKLIQVLYNMSRFATTEMPQIASVLVGLSIVCASCSTNPDPALPAYLQATLRKSSTFELLSIDPERYESETPRSPNLPRVHGYIVLGSVRITDALLRQKLISELEQAAAASDGHATCFSPRHMIRSEYQGKKIDLLICFECRNASAWIDGERQKLFSITDSPQGTYNQALTDAGIELAP